MPITKTNSGYTHDTHHVYRYGILIWSYPIRAITGISIGETTVDVYSRGMIVCCIQRELYES